MSLSQCSCIDTSTFPPMCPHFFVPGCHECIDGNTDRSKKNQTSTCDRLCSRSDTNEKNMVQTEGRKSSSQSYPLPRSRALIAADRSATRKTPTLPRGDALVAKRSCRRVQNSALNWTLTKRSPTLLFLKKSGGLSRLSCLFLLSVKRMRKCLPQ